VAYAGDQAGSLKFDGSTVGVDILRATVAVELMEALEIGALYQQAKGIDQDNGVQGGDAEETSWLGSIAYSYEAFKFKVQYGQTSGDQTDIDRTELAVGVDYKLSKALTAQAYYVTYEDKDRTVGGIEDPQTDSYGLGLVFKF
jgi:predicted porin